VYAILYIYIYIYNIYHVRRAGAVCRFPAIRKVYNIILSRNDGTHETATMGKLCTSHCLRPIRNESIVRVLYTCIWVVVCTAWPISSMPRDKRQLTRLIVVNNNDNRLGRMVRKIRKEREREEAKTEKSDGRKISYGHRRRRRRRLQTARSNSLSCQQPQLFRCIVIIIIIIIVVYVIELRHFAAGPIRTWTSPFW